MKYIIIIIIILDKEGVYINQIKFRRDKMAEQEFIVLYQKKMELSTKFKEAKKFSR